MKDLQPVRAINFTVSEAVEVLLENSLAANTRRAYRFDLERFRAWGGTIPSTPEQVASYVADASRELSVNTVRRHLSALSFAHDALDVPSNPVRHPLVGKTLQGAARHYGSAQAGVEPLLIEDLRRIVNALGDRPVEIRNKALLTLGFAGGFRRSELVGLDFEDLEFRREGVVVRIRRSKTDQSGVGRLIGIPYGRGALCPVTLVQEWVVRGKRSSGPLFTGCPKGGAVGSSRLSCEAVARIVKAGADIIGLDPTRYSGHSLRAGFVTSAACLGVPNHLVRHQTGHASDATMERYVRRGNLFRENPVGWMF